MNTDKYSSRTADKFVIRLPDGMRTRIEDVAKQNHRSMNAELVRRIEHSLLEDEGHDGTLGMSIDSPDISVKERELLKQFRQLAQRQQTAVIALITSTGE